LPTYLVVDPADVHQPLAFRRHRNPSCLGFVRLAGLLGGDVVGRLGLSARIQQFLAGVLDRD